MKLQHLMFALLAVIVAGVVSSCSERGAVLDTIPADVKMVATVDASRVCSAAGVTLKDDGSIDVVAPMEGVVDAAGLRAALEQLSKVRCEGVADVDNVVVAVDREGVTFVTLAVKDAATLEECTKDYVEWRDASGYRCASLDDMTLLAKGSQAWAVSGARDAVKALDGLLKSAGEMPVSALEGVAQALSREGVMNIAVPSDALASSRGSKAADKVAAGERSWHVATLAEGADKSLVLDWSMIEGNGASVKPKGLQNINPAMLAYVPSHFNVVCGAGLTSEFNWEPLRKLVMLAGGFQTAAFMSVVNPYLESIDGTVLLAVKSGDAAKFASGDMSDFDFLALARMPQDKINSLMSMIGSMMSTAGMTPRYTDDGLMVVPQYGKTLYIGNVDGCLGVSTVGFDNTHNNSLAPVFVNKDVAASVSLDPYNAYIQGAPDGLGITLTLSMDNGKGEAKIKATGTQWPVLVFMMTAAK